MRKAIFPFSADPITLGHIDIIDRASKLFDLVYVVVLENQSKQHLFDIAERMAMCKESLAGTHNIEIETAKGLLADYALKKGTFTIIRGIRNGEDLEYENFMEFGHRAQQEKIEFCYLLARNQFRNIRSSLVKPILLEQGQIGDFVPIPVKQQLENKLLKQKKILVAGGIASGKSTLTKKLVEYVASQNQTAMEVDFDEIVEIIYQELAVGEHSELEKQMLEYFGENILTHEKRIDKKRVSKAIFNSVSDDYAKVKQQLVYLEEILSPYIQSAYRKLIKGNEGVIFLNAPIDSVGKNRRFSVLEEANFNILLVDVDTSHQVERLVKDRKMSLEEAEIRMQANSAFDKKEKLTGLMTAMNQTDKLYIVENIEPISEEKLASIYQKIQSI